MHPGGFWVRGASGVPYTLQQPGWQSSDETRGRRHHGPPTPPTLQRTKSRSAVQCGKEPHYALSGTRTVKSHASYLCVRLAAVLVACQESCFQSQFAVSWKEWTPHIVNGMCILGFVFSKEVSEFERQDFFQRDVLFLTFFPENHSSDSQCSAIIANVVYFKSVSFAILLAFRSAAGSLAAMNHFYVQVAGSFNAQHSSALCCCFSLKRL